jgi:hypothetical protein
MTISTESILRILKNGYILGTGFLVSKDLVVTCAHVIAIKDEPIQVQFADSTEILPAQVVYEYWREPGNGDIAFLRLEKIPENRIPLRLGDAEHSPSGRQIQAFGYPNMGVIEGIHARGEILGIVAENSQRLIQLRSEELDQVIAAHLFGMKNVAW